MGVNYTHHLSLSLFVLLYLCSLSVSAVSSFEEEHHVPLFSVADLSSGRRQLELAEILSTTGLLAISDNDNHDLQANKVKKTALEGICRCSSSQEFQQLEGTDSILLGDGQTVRSTLATATLGHSPLPLPSNLEQLCGKETADALDALRDHVAHKADAFTAALDTLLKKMSVGVSVAAGSLDTPALPLLQNYHGGSYQSIEQIVQASSNLEHFHIYSKPSVKSEKQLKSQEDPALQVHTDAGLFLAFVPAHRCRSGMDHPDSSFYFEDQDGRLKRAIFPPNSVAIMLGAGAQHWLQTPSNLSLKATRHSVRMEAGVSRAWYGMSKYRL